MVRQYISAAEIGQIIQASFGFIQTQGMFFFAEVRANRILIL